MESNDKNEKELKNLFNFLTSDYDKFKKSKQVKNKNDDSNEDQSSNENIKCSKKIIIFGLKNFILNNHTDFTDLIKKIEEKQGDKISFEEFKKFWTANIPKIYDKKKLALNVMQYLGKDSHNVINAKSLVNSLENLHLFNNDVNDAQKLQTAKEMIELINIEGNGIISLSNMELLITQYYEHLEKIKNN